MRCPIRFSGWLEFWSRRLGHIQLLLQLHHDPFTAGPAKRKDQFPRRLELSDRSGPEEGPVVLSKPRIIIRSVNGSQQQFGTRISADRVRDSACARNFRTCGPYQDQGLTVEAAGRHHRRPLPELRVPTSAGFLCRSGPDQPLRSSWQSSRCSSKGRGSNRRLELLRRMKRRVAGSSPK